MEPIRGPIDHHRYPPRGQRDAAADSAAPAGGGRVLRRPHERPGAAAAMPPTANTAGHVRPRAAARRPDGAGVPVEPPHHHVASNGPHAPVVEERAARHGGRRPRRGRTLTSLPHEAPLLGTAAPRTAHEPAAAAAAARRARRNQARRAARRQRAGQRGSAPFWKLARRVTGVLLLAGCCELAAAALTTPRLAVREVQVTGLGATDPSAVEPIVESLTGQNWLRARTGAAAAQAARLPGVRSATVRRLWSLPPMKLELELHERVPFARVGAGDKWWVVDRDGVPFRPAGAADQGLYAVCSPGIKPRDIRPGLALAPAVWQPFVALAGALQANLGPRHQWRLRRTYLDRFGYASLRLRGAGNDDLLLRLGDDEWPRKLRRARLALDYLAATGRTAATLNLVSYNTPTWTPRPRLAASDNTEIDANSTAAGDDSSNAAPLASSSSPPRPTNRTGAASEETLPPPDGSGATATGTADASGEGDAGDAQSTTIPAPGGRVRRPELPAAGQA